MIATRPEHVQPALEESLRDLGLEYLDLYLIHWPVVHQYGVVRPESGSEFCSLDEVPLSETWQAMEDCVSKGLCKSIGVSNFSIAKLDELLSKASVVPAVNQVECHPFFPQTALLDWCEENTIKLIAYSPLGSGDRPDHLKKADEPSLLQHEVVAEIAAARDVRPAQILIAWAVNRGTIVIPKSTNPDRQKQNLEATTIALSEQEMAQLKELNHGYRYVDGKFWERPDGPYTVANLWDE